MFDRGPGTRLSHPKQFAREHRGYKLSDHGTTSYRSDNTSPQRARPESLLRQWIVPRVRWRTKVGAADEDEAAPGDAPAWKTRPAQLGIGSLRCKLAR